MVPITTKTHVKQGGGSWKPYKSIQIHTTKITFPNCAAFPPGFPRFLPSPKPNELQGVTAESSSRHSCQTTWACPALGTFANAIQTSSTTCPPFWKWNVCFRDVGSLGMLFWYSSLGWLKRIGFFWEQLLFLGHGLFFGPWKSLWRIYMFWRDPHWTCCYTFGSESLKIPASLTSFWVMSWDCYTSFAPKRIETCIISSCKWMRSTWGMFPTLMPWKLWKFRQVFGIGTYVDVDSKDSHGAWVWTAVGISLTSASTCINRPQKIKGKEDMRRYKIVRGHLVVCCLLVLSTWMKRDILGHSSW